MTDRTDDWGAKVLVASGRSTPPGCSKIVEMEEELRVVGNNLKSLELSEEKALAREDAFQLQIRELDARLKEVGGGGGGSRTYLRAGPLFPGPLSPPRYVVRRCLAHSAASTDRIYAFRITHSDAH